MIMKGVIDTRAGFSLLCTWFVNGAKHFYSTSHLYVASQINCAKREITSILKRGFVFSFLRTVNISGLKTG